MMPTMTAQRKRGKGQRNYRADGEMLRHYRGRAHLTLEELEEASGVSYTTISRIENGAIVSPRWNTLRPLAKALGVEVDELVVHDLPERDVPSEPGMTEANRERYEEVKRDKNERDRENTDRGSRDTGDRTT